jgi:hypothetical protein
MASRNRSAYTEASGRLCHSWIRGRILSVTLEISVGETLMP